MAGRVVLVLAVVLSAAACTGEKEPPPPDGKPSSFGLTVSNAIERPANVRASLVGDGDDRRLEVSVPPTSDADAWLVALEKSAEPIRLEPADCAQGTCRVAFDRLTAGDATSLTVTAVAGEQASPRSDAIMVPSWPPPERPAAPRSGPVTLVVTRARGEGAPVVRTETIARKDVEARVAKLESTPGVLGVSVDAPAEAHQQTDPQQWPEYPEGLATWQQEALNFQGLPEEPRGRGVTVAVIDSGVHETHPALQGAAITQRNVVERGEAVPGNHGTAVTSLIVGQPGGRVPGIATGATVRVYDVNNGERSSVEDLARAIIEAVDDGADVISLSTSVTCGQIGPVHLGCPPDALEPAVEYAEREGVVVVASAGNDGDGAERCEGGGLLEGGGPLSTESNADHWPAKYSTVIAVGGTTRSGEPWVCSPDKDYIDVLAPADGLLVAWGENGYAVQSGTSLATPLVAGVIAAVLAERPDLTPAEIRALLADSVGEHRRLVPSVLMALLGIQEGPGVDLTTLREIMPFRAEVSYRPGHPVRTVADSLYAVSPESLDWTPMHFFYPGGGDFKLVIGGVFFVGRDGSVSGYARVKEPRFQVFGPVLQRHEIFCGSKIGILHPSLAFGWDIRAVVHGQVSGTSPQRPRSIRFTVSLGEGATAQAAGRLPGIVILEDTLDRCQEAIALSTRLHGRPSWTWGQVLRKRNHVVPALEGLYRKIVETSPFEVEGSYPPAARALPGPLQSGHQSGNLQVHLRIGQDPNR